MNAGTLALLAVALVPGERRATFLSGGRPWRMAFAFGLLHGLGFAGALAEIGLPPSEIPLALVSFNLGIELGQLALIVAATVAWRLVRPLQAALPHQLPRLAGSYGIGSLAGYWVLERASAAWLTW